MTKKEQEEIQRNIMQGRNERTEINGNSSAAAIPR